MADIFLSYTEKDRDTVRRIAETLQVVGWSVWWDRRIPAGSTWRALLEGELQSMRCMVVVWSSHSVASDWVHEEASEGRLLGRLIPVLIEAVRPPAGFREIQSADLVDWDGTASALGMRRLVEDIERRIGRPADATSAATPAPLPMPAARRPPISRRMVLVGTAALSIGLAAIAVGAIRSGGEQHDPAPAPTAAVADPVPLAGTRGHDDPTSGRQSGDGSAPAGSPIAAAGTPGDQPSASKPAPSRCLGLQFKVAVGEPLSAAERKSIERECTQ